MPIDDGLGFRERNTLVDSSANKQRRQDLPRFKTLEGNTLLHACMILIIDEKYNVAVMDVVV
jgi:hypothetical protein